jgi:hypothetical protein
MDWSKLPLVVAGVLWASSAGASSDKRGRVVLVEGPGSDAVAGWLEDGLNAPDTPEEEDLFREGLRARGALPLQSAVDSAARDARLVIVAHAAAGQADVDGALLVHVRKTSHATRVHLWNMDVRPGGAMVESDITLPPSASAAQEGKAILALVAPSAAAAKTAPAPVPVVTPPAPSEATAPTEAPPAEVPARVVEAPPAPDRAAPSAPAERDERLLDLQAGVGIGLRHFEYTDRITPSLRPYTLPAAPLASIAASVYPFAGTHTPLLRDLGITGDYAQAFAISSEDSTGAHVDSTWRTFDVGARERIPITRAVEAGVAVAYGGNDFQFDQPLAGAAAQLPSASYRFVRAGADGRVRLLPAFSAFGGGSYLAVLSTGYTGDLFSRESVGGVEAHLGASWSIARSWEASVSASYTRFFYAMNPVPGDASVAGGAIDEQARALLGLSYVM